MALDFKLEGIVFWIGKEKWACMGGQERYLLKIIFNLNDFASYCLVSNLLLMG